MADTVPMIVETGNGFGGANALGGFGGYGAGAGFVGGLLVGAMLNGGWGGWGGNGWNRGGQAAADVSLANSIEHVSDAVNQGTISQLQSAQGITNGINQNTIAGLQGTAQLADKMCASTFGLAQQIDQNGDATVAAINQSVVEAMRNAQGVNDRLCCINNNITTQGYEARLQSQALAAQLAQQHSELSRQIYEENCKDRELQREIAAQNVRDQLAQAQAQNAALTAQINLTNQLTAQTAYLVAQLGGTAAARATTTAAA